MKILQIINNLGSGGAEKLLEELIPLMNSIDDIEVDVLLLTDKNNVFDAKLKSQDIKIEIIKFKNIYSPVNTLEIIKYIKSGNYDIVHSHLFPSQYWVGLSKTFISNNVKFVTTEHSTYNRRRNNKFFKLIDRYIYSKYDSIISITNRVQKNLLEWLRPKKREFKKYVVIGNGIMLEKFIKATPYVKHELNNNFTEDIKLICMVSRFGEQKDQKTAIKVMDTLPDNIHLLLVGDGPLKSENEELSNKLNLNDRVHFLGYRDDIERILKTVDIVLLSSKWEGLSLSSMEGMASGKPFVASRVEGLEEMVNGNGLLFEQGNIDELKNIINALINDKELYKEVSSRCHNKALEYDITNMLNKTLSLYRKLMN